MNNFTVFTNKYACAHCDIKCSRESEWKRHILTRKHVANTSGDEVVTKNIFTCEKCNKEYNSRNGIWKHNKTCIEKEILSENVVIKDSSNNVVVQLLIKENSEIKKENTEIKKENSEIKTMIMDLVKSNTELQKQMLEVVCKNIQQQQPTNVNNTKNENNTTVNNTNNTINANKTFNLNFFLNEQCKNAMNLKDFVDSMEVTLEDAEKIGEEGYVEGMSSLVIKKINETDVFLRPIHCSDSKRDILHIKRNDKWERDGPNNEHLTMAIKYIEQKNMVALDQIGEKYPDWKDIDSPHNDKYMNMILKLTDSGPEEYKKVVKKIIKEVVIDKENV